MHKTISFLFVVLFLTLSGVAVAADQFGELVTFNAGEVYYTKNVTKIEADKLGETLVATNFFNGSPKTIQLDKKNGRYKFRMVVKSGIDRDKDLEKSFKMMTLELSMDVFEGAPTDVELCDKNLITLKEIKFEEESEYGKLLMFNHSQLFYVPAIKAEEAKALGEYLIKEKFFDSNIKTVQLNKDNDTYQFRFVVKKGIEKDQEYLKIIRRFSRELSAALFKNAAVDVHLCDGDLRTVKAVKMPSEEETDSTFGTLLNFNNGELFYTAGVSKEDAENLGKYLVDEGFFDGVKKTVQIAKKGDTYLFRMVVKKGKETDESYLKIVRSFAGELSEKIFHRSPVAIHLCDASLETLKAVEMGEAASPFGTKLEFNGGDLFYTERSTPEQATKLGNYLVKENFYDGRRKTVQLNKSGTTYEFRMVVQKGMDENEDFIKTMKSVAKELSENVFNGDKVEVHLCDDQLETLRVVIPLH